MPPKRPNPPKNAETRPEALKPGVEEDAPLLHAFAPPDLGGKDSCPARDAGDAGPRLGGAVWRKPIRLREQVKRNPGRFPADFMFQLGEKDAKIVVSQNAIPSRQHLGGARPYAFTEQGIASLSAVLTSERAIQAYVAIMQAFIEMRRTLHAHAGLFQRLDGLEQRQIGFEAETDKRFEHGAVEMLERLR